MTKWDIMERAIIRDIRNKQKFQKQKQEQHDNMLNSFISSAMDMKVNGKPLFKLVDKRTKRKA